MFINKLPTTKSYWKREKFLDNEGIRNVMARSSFEDILRNHHFSDNAKNEKSDKVSNKRFSNSVSNDDSQIINEHVVKVKDRSSFKQYVKSKPIKWGFKFWYHFSSKTVDLYLGKKTAEENLGPSVVLEMTESLPNSNCMFFYNFSNSLSLVVKLYERCFYSIGTPRKDRKGMS